MSKKTITAPVGLTKPALAFWHRAKDALERRGEVSLDDYDILRLAAQSFEQNEQAAKDVKANGIVLTTMGDRGYEVTKTNPAVAALNQAATRLLGCLRQLELTPASRGRGGRGGNNGDDPIGDLLNS